MKHNPRCPFCGAPTRAQPFRERTAYQCTECASLCVGPEVASELLLAMTGTPAGAPVRRRPSTKRNMPLVTVGLAAVFLLLALPLALAVYSTVRAVRPGAPPRVVEVPVVVTLPPTPTVAPVPVAAPPPPPEPVHAPVEAATPPVEPAPAPAPRSARASIDLGWKRLDSNPSSAADAFRQALEQAPGNAEARYGLGYALLQSGDRAAGAKHLCASLVGAPADMRREVESLLTHNDLKCP